MKTEQQAEHESIDRLRPAAVMVFGCGYVGTALAKSLLAKRVKVGGLTRNAAQADRLRALGLDPVVCARLDDDGWHARLDRHFDACVNCVSAAERSLDGYRQSYRDGQLSINAWARTQSLRTAIFTSSTSVYPQGGGARVDETSETTDASATGQIILAGEKALLDASDLYTKRFVFRLAGIYGPGRHYLLDGLREGRRELPGSGAHNLNLIHRDDIVSAIERALFDGELAVDGIYNLVDGCPVCKSELVAWLAAELGLPEPSFDPTQRIRRGSVRAAVPDRIIDASKARELLGWLPAFPDYKTGYRALLNKH